MKIKSESMKRLRELLLEADRLAMEIRKKHGVSEAYAAGQVEACTQNALDEIDYYLAASE